MVNNLADDEPIEQYADLQESAVWRRARPDVLGASQYSPLHVWTRGRPRSEW